MSGIGDKEQSLCLGLEALKNAGLYRQQRTAQVCAIENGTTEVFVDGKRCLAFCSNDYLGLTGHSRLITAFREAANTYGVGSGSAHLISGHSPEHEALEESLAAFTGRQRALLFSTGYMANLGIAQALLGRGDLMIEDKLNHASLIDAAKLCGAEFKRYRHGEAAALTERLASADDQRVMVATDGVFSMDGDFAPLAELSVESQKFGAWLMVDDAHGIGVLGETGRGVLEHFGLNDTEVPIYMATLGKALGSFGAFVAGSEALIETLIQKARTYIYTTASPPAVAAASLAALELVDEEPWRRDELRDRIEYFRQAARALGLPLAASSTAIQPIILGDAGKAMTVSARLLRAGIWVTAIRPPTVPKGSARLRIALSACHSRSHIDRLMDALKTLDLAGDCP